MKQPAILLVEGDEAVRKSLKEVLLCHELEWEILGFSDEATVLRSLRGRSPDLVIIGSPRDGTWDELEVAQGIRRWDHKIPIVLITADNSEERLIAALRVGINDYLKLPLSPEELASSIQRCLPHAFPPKTSRRQKAKPEKTVPGLLHDPWMIGESLAIRKIKGYIRKVAPTDSNVLITGETGTGKELTADLIHQNSPRRQQPFVSLNCAAIPESLLESELFGYEKGAFTGAHATTEGKLRQAQGGTIFLDEIGDMTLSTQAKILRAIENKEIQRLGGRGSLSLNIRVVAATNQNLERLVLEDKFRKDLYFRLNVARIHLPPLRERKEDISLLLDHYIRELNRRFGQEVEGLAEEALEYLLCYDWPGNIRELKNLLEATFVNLPPRRISWQDFPEQFRNQLRDTELLPKGERDRLLFALLSTNWNKSKAAQKLRWSRMTLYRKMEKYQILKRGKKEGNRATPT